MSNMYEFNYIILTTQCETLLLNQPHYSHVNIPIVMILFCYLLTIVHNELNVNNCYQIQNKSRKRRTMLWSILKIIVESDLRITFLQSKFQTMESTCRTTHNSVDGAIQVQRKTTISIATLLFVLSKIKSGIRSDHWKMDQAPFRKLRVKFVYFALKKLIKST